MRSLAYVAVAALIGAGAAHTSLAQPMPPPLTYVQPLSRQAVQEVQARLRQAGVYTGRIDGVWGQDSEAALQRFQQVHQLQVTGQMNEATAATLGVDPSRLVAAAQPMPPPTVPPPGGTLSQASVRAVQDRLHALGFYNGNDDGIWGEGTQEAIERFQQGRGLQPNGQLNPATLQAMGLAPDTLTLR
jgi:peptidoglycan hydrolase-like protein with peptidoglycan-binding domain